MFLGSWPSKGFVCPALTSGNVSALPSELVQTSVIVNRRRATVCFDSGLLTGSNQYYLNFVLFLATGECSSWPRDLGRCCAEAETSVSVDASVCVCV